MPHCTSRVYRVGSRRTLVRSAVLLVGIAGWLLASGHATHAADLSGVWKGHWQSCTDQFSGTVKARITRIAPGKYQAVFTGRAFKVMPYRYTATLLACKDPATGKVRFRCTRKLPFWGSYWMNGTAGDCCLNARYRTDDHTGYFVMRRIR